MKVTILANEPIERGNVILVAGEILYEGGDNPFSITLDLRQEANIYGDALAIIVTLKKAGIPGVGPNAAPAYLGAVPQLGFVNPGAPVFKIKSAGPTSAADSTPLFMTVPAGEVISFLAFVRR